MSHKIYGDVSPEDQRLAIELVELEEILDEKGLMLSSDRLAKGYVCLACDWYSLGSEETGKLLLNKAEKACPNYFKNEIHLHMKEDDNYSFLIKNLSKNIIRLMSEIIF
jgi:hypothetical protein